MASESFPPDVPAVSFPPDLPALVDGLELLDLEVSGDVCTVDGDCLPASEVGGEEAE